MRARIWTLTIAIVMAAAVALPSAASALTKTVYAGPPPSLKTLAQKIGGKGFKAVKAENPDINSFFQTKVTINEGDTVKFVINGFHTIDLPGKSNADLPFFVTGATVTGDNDAAGSPFWFNGHVPSLGVDLNLLHAIGSKTYNGTKRLATGIFTGNGNPPPFNVKFAKPGVYKYFCDIHPGMVGSVVVLPKGKTIPSARQDTAAVTKQVTADIHTALKLVKSKPPADHVSLGESGPGGVELYSMFPATLHVNAGTVVTFSMSHDSRDVHTASFGPSAYLTALSNSILPTPAQHAVYPSDPGTISLSPTSHGNGFANTGILDEDPTTPPGTSDKIDFTTPGTYHFICLIHAFMTGTIVVK